MNKLIVRDVYTNFVENGRYVKWAIESANIGDRITTKLTISDTEKLCNQFTYEKISDADESEDRYIPPMWKSIENGNKFFEGYLFEYLTRPHLASESNYHNEIYFE